MTDNKLYAGHWFGQDSNIPDTHKNSVTPVHGATEKLSPLAGHKPFTVRGAVPVHARRTNAPVWFTPPLVDRGRPVVGVVATRSLPDAVATAHAGKWHPRGEAHGLHPDGPTGYVELTDGTSCPTLDSPSGTDVTWMDGTVPVWAVVIRMTGDDGTTGPGMARIVAPRKP